MKSGTIERFGGTYSLSVINLGRPNTTFNMEGGVIQNCTTPNGLSGIVVGITSSGNTFNMTGGEIKDCATVGFGVIYASNATIHIGGSARITNNKSSNGGAFYVKNGTRLKIDGSAVIEGRRRDLCVRRFRDRRQAFCRRDRRQRTDPRQQGPRHPRRRRRDLRE